MIKAIKAPYFVVSAHRDVVYTFDYDTRNINLSLFNQGGKLALFGNPFSEPIIIGQYLFIISGTYKGYHYIEDIIGGSIFVTSTTYTVAQNAADAKHITSHNFQIFKGYSSGSLTPYLPFEQIARFSPEPNSEGLLVFNISGYINKIFEVRNSNDVVTVGSVDVWINLFNQVGLYLEDNIGVAALVKNHVAINSALDMYELNRLYVDTGRYINGGNLGNHYLSCGITTNQKIEGGLVVTATVYEGIAITNDRYFDDGFSNGFAHFAG